MKVLSQFVQSVLGGAAVGIGGIAYLSVDSKPLGAFLFAVGLFCICTMGFSLYTGKVCSVCVQKPRFLGVVGFVWLGNLVGAVLTGWLIGLTRFAPALTEKAALVCEAKLNDGLLSVFILAVFCNIMIYIAADSYTNVPHELGKYLGIVLGVMVFVLAGFEHCVANMFYFTVGGAWSAKTVLYLLVATLGNAVGGNLWPMAKQLRKKAEA